jgi:hypothetical protein
MNKPLPPAPRPGAPVTVTMEDLPDWLEAHGLEIVGGDASGRMFVAKKQVERTEGHVDD